MTNFANPNHRNDDMTTLEEAKKNIARAEELERALKDGKMVEFRGKASTNWESSTLNKADDFFYAASNGTEHRIIEPKRRRPWTREEAERHVGWVLVPHDGVGREPIHSVCENAVDTHTMHVFFTSMTTGWRVHLPGQPDDLKPCSVEE